jgi:hypothetical protein
MAERGAMIITWGTGRAGVPPEKGMEVFGESLTYYDELAKEGRIAGYRTFASTTTERGTLVIEGEMAELARIMTSTESTRLLARASAVVEDLDVDLCIGGSVDEITGYYTRAFEAVADLGLT